MIHVLSEYDNEVDPHVREVPHHTCQDLLATFKINYWICLMLALHHKMEKLVTLNFLIPVVLEMKHTLFGNS